MVHSRWRKVKVLRSRDGSTPSRERSNYGDKMNTISRYGNYMVGGYRRIRQEDFNDTFGADFKSDLLQVAVRNCKTRIAMR
jgi:hypothetical protein